MSKCSNDKLICFVSDAKDSFTYVFRVALSSFRTEGTIVSIITENPVVIVGEPECEVHRTLE